MNGHAGILMKWWGLALLMLSFASAPALAQTGGVTGRVLDETNAGISGATVRVVAGPQRSSTQSSADGAYELRSLPRGFYRLTASADGFTSSTRDVRVADAMVRVDFTLRRRGGGAPGSIAGVVTDASNRARIPGVRIAVVGGSTSRSATSNAAGEYRIDELPPGSYRLTATREGYAPLVRAAVIVRSGAVTEVNLSMRPRASEQGRIFGRVTAAGRAVEGATVSLLSQDVVIATAVTGPSGTYQFPRLTSGVYALRARASGFAEVNVEGVEVRTGEQVKVDINLTPLSTDTGSIEGVVQNADAAAIRGAVVRVLAGPVTGRFALTDEFGAYELLDLPAGQYRLRASAEGYVDSFREITVTANQFAVADFTLQRGVPTGRGSIGGRLMTAGEQGIGSGRVRVIEGPVTGREATADSDGDYVLIDLPPGRYAVSATASGYRERVVRDVDVVANERTLLNIILEPIGEGGSAELLGSITNTAGAALGGARIEARRGSSLVGSAVSSSTGFYRITGLAAGSYTVRVSRSGYVARTFNDVQLVDGERKRLNVVLSPSGGGGGSATIKGRVQSSTGQAIRGARVTAVRGDVEVEAVTDTAGDYELTNLPAGTYSVTASATGYASRTERNLILEAGATRTVNFSLSASGGGAAGRIAGAVFDRAGRKLPSARVVVVEGPRIPAGTTTDANGLYTFTEMPAGSYILEASLPGYRTVRGSVVVESGETARRNFFLPIADF